MRPVHTRAGLTLPRACLGSFWISTWRGRARHELADARAAVARAERLFAEAVRYAAAGDERSAWEYFEIGFSAFEHAARCRRYARNAARAALTGRLDC